MRWLTYAGVAGSVLCVLLVSSTHVPGAPYLPTWAAAALPVAALPLFVLAFARLRAERKGAAPMWVIGTAEASFFGGILLLAVTLIMGADLSEALVQQRLLGAVGMALHTMPTMLLR